MQFDSSRLFKRLLQNVATTLIGGTFLWLLTAQAGFAEVNVTVERSEDTFDFGFSKILAPAIDDAGAVSQWRIVRGTASSNGGSLKALSDGKIPSSEDSPSENFFFDNATERGSILIDLGSVQEIAQVATYSWHPAERAPQVLTLFGLESIPNDHAADWDKLSAEQNPSSVGWKHLADVNTNQAANGNGSELETSQSISGGQHASLISDPNGTLGAYRYLLLDCKPSVAGHPFGRTFFSEVDVITSNAEKLKRVESTPRKSFAFATDDGRYQFTMDVTAAPHLENWCSDKLKPVVQEWYPRIVEMLPSKGFSAPTSVTLQFLPNSRMNGIPAYAQNNKISMNAEWYSRELKREALGATVHELVHVVQQYNKNRSRDGIRRSPTPGWITEGIPDYIRWFLYEPESKGALLSKEALKTQKHDASYRVSANFLDFAIRKYDRDDQFLLKLNAAAREGRYQPGIFKELTGLDLAELEQAWRNGE